MGLTIGIILNSAQQAATSAASFLQPTENSFTQFQNNLQQTLGDRNTLQTDKLLNANDPSLTQGSQNYPQSVQSASNVSSTSNFASIQTLDTYAVQVQATYLQGLIASKVPLLPMVFNVVLPDVAITNGATLIPPLTLFVNPKTWSRSINKKNTNTYTRGGYKSERWGEELEQIDATGDLGAFYTADYGLTRLNRSQTPSYRNLLQLVQIFKNNGCYYGNMYPGNTYPGYSGIQSAATQSVRILSVGYVEILYGHETFRGTFDSLSIKESAERPFTLSYSFTFFVGEVVSIYDSTSLTSSIDIPTYTAGADVPQAVQDAYQNSSAAQGAAQAQSLNPASTLDNPNNTSVLGSTVPAAPLISLGGN